MQNNKKKGGGGMSTTTVTNSVNNKMKKKKQTTTSKKKKKRGGELQQMRGEADADKSTPQYTHTNTYTYTRIITTCSLSLIMQKPLIGNEERKKERKWKGGGEKAQAHTQNLRHPHPDATSHRTREEMMHSTAPPFR
jgi:hypothetical protein